MQLIINNDKKQLEFTGEIQKLLKQEKIRREEVVIKVNGKLAPETTIVGDKDTVEIIKVVFGG
ncbi:MAG: MoaD/ThiS family protein [Candidatus Micrarchaeota archaeon]